MWYNGQNDACRNDFLQWNLATYLPQNLLLVFTYVYFKLWQCFEIKRVFLCVYSIEFLHSCDHMIYPLISWFIFRLFLHKWSRHHEIRDTQREMYGLRKSSWNSDPKNRTYQGVFIKKVASKRGNEKSVIIMKQLNVKIFFIRKKIVLTFHAAILILGILLRCPNLSLFEKQKPYHA